MTSTGTRACTGCHAAWYCSHLCQKIAWKAHKRICKERAGDALARAASVIPYGSMDDDGVPRFAPNERAAWEDGVLFEHFLASAKKEPFYSYVRDLRDVDLRDVELDAEAEEREREMSGKPRSLTGSEQQQSDRRVIDRSRARYTDLVKAKGTIEQRQLWSKLCRDAREELVYRVVTTPLLGGIFAKTAAHYKAEEEWGETDPLADSRFWFVNGSSSKKRKKRM